MKRGRAILAVPFVAAVALILYIYGSGTQAPPGQPPLTYLNAGDFSTLKNQFNASPDSVRVILWLSPT